MNKTSKKYNFFVHKKQLKYADLSLFLFDKNNPFRKACVWLTE